MWPGESVSVVLPNGLNNQDSRRYYLGRCDEHRPVRVVLFNVLDDAQVFV